MTELTPIELTVQVWCQSDTSHIVMDEVLCAAFADTLRDYGRAEYLRACQAYHDYTRAVISERDALRKELAELRLQAISDIGQEIDAEPKVEPVQEPQPLEDLTGVRVCCGEYATCYRPCTPRGRFEAGRELDGLRKAAQMALEFAYLMWTDGNLNDYMEEKREALELALRKELGHD